MNRQNCPFISSSSYHQAPQPTVQYVQTKQGVQGVTVVRQQSPIRMTPIVHQQTTQLIGSQNQSPLRSKLSQNTPYTMFDSAPQTYSRDPQQEKQSNDLANEVHSLKLELMSTKIQLEQEKQKNVIQELDWSQEPTRNYMDDPNTTWRNGHKPNYQKANEKYLKEKMMTHQKESLEKVIENAVKTWEMEASHKTDKNQWGSVNPDKYHISSNGKQKNDINHVIKNGTYNTLLQDEAPLYDSSQKTFESSHATFKNLFKSGFAWEVIKAYAGPPDLAFSWRHWGHSEGTYVNSKGVEIPATGKLVELWGFSIINVDKDLKVNDIQVFADNKAFLEAIENGTSSYDVAKNGFLGCSFLPNY